MLIGREPELEVLSKVAAQAREGLGGVVVVRGEPGVGKTAMLQRFADQLRGVLTLTTVGIESESSLAFAALHRLLLPLLENLPDLPEPQARALRRAFGSQDAADRSEDRFLTYLGALSLLGDAAETTPVVCIVDDAHWLDEPSADALRFVARRAEGLALAIVFAARVGDVRRFDAPDLDELTVTGLGWEDAEHLIAAARPGLDPGVGQALWRRTGGNPLALLEVPKALTATQARNAAALPEQLPVTEHLREVFTGQLQRLPQQAQLYLLMVSLEGSGDPGVLEVAAARLGIDSHSIQVAERSDLVDAGAGRVRLRHPLIGSAIAASFAEPERRHVHAALAFALEQHHDVDRAVWHRASAATPPDDLAAQELERAARRFSARGGHEAASAAYERAAQLTSGQEEAGSHLLSSAAAAWQAADPQRARTLAQRARGLSTSGGVLAEIDRHRAFIEMNFGSPRLAHGMLIGAATEALETADPFRAAQLAMVASALKTFGFDSGATLPSGFVDHVSAVAAHERPATALLLRGFSAWTTAWTPEAADTLRQAIALEDGEQAADVLTNLGIAALQLGDDSATDHLHSLQLDAARTQGAPLGVIHALTRRSIMQLAAGEWRELQVDSAEVLDLARATGHENQRAFPLAAVLAVDAFRGADDIDERAEEVEALLKEHPGGVLNALTRDVLSWARGVEASNETPAAALQHFGRLATAPVKLAAALDWAEAALRAEEPGQVEHIASEMQRFAAATRNSWALDAAALLAAPAASPEQRESLLLERVHAPAGSRAPVRGRLLLAYGEHLRRSRRRVQARSALRQAHAIFDTLGLAPLRDRAGSELRASGETVRRSTPSNETAPARLTAQELQVARAVQRGLSNRDIAAQMFLSPRTVEFHLRNIFSKLQLTSRAELFRFDLDAAS